jgi:peptidoglycan hydrolase CwlO-like protein
MKKLLIVAIACLLGTAGVKAQTVLEDKTSTSEKFIVPTTEPELLEAKTFLTDLGLTLTCLTDLIAKEAAAVVEEEKALELITSNMSKLDPTDPELKEAQKEIAIINADIKNLKMLLDVYKKDLALVEEALAKLKP